jgi:arylsulfatase A-like enzyme
VEPRAPEQCPSLPANFAIPENEPDIIREIQARDDRAYPSRGWTEGKWRQYRYAYYRLIERVDAQIGKILDALRESGQDRNTVIIFASDHGDGNAAHRWNQKQVLYEEPARVPFIVSWPSRTPAGRTDSTHLVSSCIDLIPTMCEFAGITPPRNLRGRSVASLALGRPANGWRTEVVSQTEFCGFGNSFGVHGRMLRTGSLKYVVYSEGKLREQLCDLKKDRGEMNNLAVSPRHVRELTMCREKLARWMDEHGDRFDIPSGTPARRAS